MAAKGKARTIIVRLVSTALTGYFYTTQRLRQGGRLSAIKYDPVVGDDSMVDITVLAASKPPSFASALPQTFGFPSATDVTVLDVKKAIYKRFPKFYPTRQKLSLKGGRNGLRDESTLAEVGLEKGGELTVKDLGPQAEWKTVFIVEYVGPLIIHPLFYYFPKLFYGRDVKHSPLQRYIFVMVMLHYLKRELETFFLHRFSHATMPAWYIIRNSFHYYVLGGLFLAYSVYSPTYTAESSYIKGTIRSDPTFLLTGALAWVVAELSNFWTHMTLRNLRTPGTKERGIPYGYGFALVSCPNYFFELVSWWVVSAMTGSWSAYLFTAVSIKMMWGWAFKKHGAYRKEFGDKYPKDRKALIPFII